MKRAEWWGGQCKWTMTGARHVEIEHLTSEFAYAFCIDDLCAIATTIDAPEHIAQGSIEGFDPGRNQLNGAEYRVVMFASNTRGR